MKNIFLIVGILITFLTGLNVRAQSRNEPPPDQSDLRVQVETLRCSGDTTETLLDFSASTATSNLVQLPHDIFSKTGCEPYFLKYIRAEGSREGFGFVSATITAKTEEVIRTVRFGLCSKFLVETATLKLFDTENIEIIMLTSVAEKNLGFTQCVDQL